ncbi:hypothetical protein [Anaerorhabdus sp.]|uniref:hypothetical protein n=1 Tax=Anaerorhabdus sp. TaxID=1872524 RepID=UPI002FCA1CFE
MKYAMSSININPPFPIKLGGFIQQVNPVSTIHDDLHARIISFADQGKKVYLVSCDNLGFKINVQNEIQNKLGPNCTVILSCTHTHFAPDSTNTEYQEYFINKVYNECMSLVYTTGDLSIKYVHEKFDKIGKSRISNHIANVVLQVLSIFDKDKCIATIITHNCHPTILSGDTPYISSEYPGYVIKKLSKDYKDVFFSFFQGATGDISSRFTRITQDYAGVEYLGNILVDEIKKIINTPSVFKSFNTFDIHEHVIPMEHDLSPINLSDIPLDLTEREKETIDIGIKVRERLLHNIDSLDKEIVISSLKLESINLIFAPNELFSYYTKAIDEDNSVLICYSNGYSPYVSGINENYITYETFTDTLTTDTKHKIFDTIHILSSL